MVDAPLAVEAVRRTLDQRHALQRARPAPDQIEPAVSAADIGRIAHAGKIAAVLSAEGGHQINYDLAILRQYRFMGVLSMTLTLSDTTSYDALRPSPRQ